MVKYGPSGDGESLQNVWISVGGMNHLSQRYSLEEGSLAFPCNDPWNGRGVIGILYRCSRDSIIT